MPWEGIANSVLKLKESRRNARNDQWAKLMQAAGLGKSIWDTLNEQNKYKPGSDFYNFTERQNLGIPQELAESGLTREQRLQQSAADIAEKAQSAGFGRESAQGTEKFKQAQELQGQQDKAALERARLTAGKTATEKQAQMMAAIQEAFSTAQVRGDWFIADPVNPTQKVVNPNTIDQLRANILKAIAVYRPTADDMVFLTPYINDLLSGGVPSAGKPTGAPIPKPIFNPPPPEVKKKPNYQDISSLAKRLYEAKSKARGDQQATRELDYIQGQMPRAGFIGGPDYTENPIEWLKGALQTIDRILGVVPVDQSFRGMGSPALK